MKFGYRRRTSTPKLTACPVSGIWSAQRWIGSCSFVQTCYVFAPCLHDASIMPFSSSWHHCNRCGKAFLFLLPNEVSFPFSVCVLMFLLLFMVSFIWPSFLARCRHIPTVFRTDSSLHSPMPRYMSTRRKEGGRDNRPLTPSRCFGSTHIVR